MHWIIIRELELEALKRTQWQNKLVRNRKPSKLETKERVDETLTFLWQEVWPIDVNATEVRDAIVIYIIKFKFVNVLVSAEQESDRFAFGFLPLKFFFFGFFFSPSLGKARESKAKKVALGLSKCNTKCGFLWFSWEEAKSLTRGLFGDFDFWFVGLRSVGLAGFVW